MSRVSHSKLFVICTLACVGLMACAMDPDEEPTDPAGDLGDEEWSDEGPLPEDVASDTDPLDELAAAGPPRFQLPFRCGQVWAGQTRTSHSPQNAIDFNRANDVGDLVLAAAAGKVTRVENEGNTSYGRWIEIGHGGGHRTRYAHLNKQLVSVGQKVTRGQRIGRVGSTGGSSGPHLHYEQRKNGVAVRATFNGQRAFYFGTRNYKSRNRCN